MTPSAIQQAATLLIGARRTGMLLDELPESCRPTHVDEAHAVQDATVKALGDRVAGWKVGAALDGRIVRGAILQSRVFASGAAIPAALVPLLGVEAEVAFHFDHALAPRERAYTYDEVAAAVTAFSAIEIVDSRFRDYRGTPLIQRIADCVSNGAFVAGASVRRWRDIDLAKLDARIEADGKVLARKVGGHPTGDPLLPAVDLVNDLRKEGGVQAGQFMTTGTYTGLNFVAPGQRVHATLENFGSVDVELSDETP